MKKSILASYILTVVMVTGSLILGNPEFALYGAVLLPLVGLMHWSDKHFDYQALFLWGFAAWLFAHLMGGLLVIGEVRLYDLMIINIVGDPYWVLKYDQVMHVYTYIVMAGLLGSIVDSITKKSANKWTVAVVLVLAASGIGGINEILEFMPVIFFNSPGPGGYINTAIDICANLVGAIIGTWIYLK